jgi:uncharacterized protein DUF4383
MLKSICILFGIVFIAVGILGFVPGVTHGEHLLGIFHVNAAHNAVHILSGIAALICGSISTHAARMYFRIFGLVYGLVAVLGFVNGDRPIFGLISNNMADTWLHVAIAAVSLILGFVVRETPRQAPAVP